MNSTNHLNREELEAGLGDIRQSPKNNGTVRMIVRRPQTDEREVISLGALDIAEGLIGDNWHCRGSRHTADGSADPDMQLNIMNARVIALVAGSEDRWALAGDQIYVDLDLSKENLPAGTQLQLGSAIIEVTDIPHLGCKKFVNSDLGKELCLRGINARVVQSGTVNVGDIASKT